MRIRSVRTPWGQGPYRRRNTLQKEAVGLPIQTQGWISAQALGHRVVEEQPAVVPPAKRPVVAPLELAHVQEDPDEVVGDGVRRALAALGHRAHAQERNRAGEVHLVGTAGAGLFKAVHLHTEEGAGGPCGQRPVGLLLGRHSRGTAIPAAAYPSPARVARPP